MVKNIVNNKTTGEISRWGNSRAIRLPKQILSRANMFENLSICKGGVVPVEIEATTDSIIIRRAPEKLEQEFIFSQEQQYMGFMEFRKAMKSMKDNSDEPLPDNFFEDIKFQDRSFVEEMWGEAK